jgi:hypothetical protein
MKYMVMPTQLGDMIVSTGMINYFSKSEKIVVPCLKHNELSVRSFFDGNENVEISVIETPRAMEAWLNDANKLCIKVYNYAGMVGHLSMSFAPRFYQSVGLPYEIRWEYGNLLEQAKKVKQLPVPTESYIFIHTDIKRKIIIDESLLPIGMYKVYALPYEQSILAYMDLIINATELHFIDSCFLHLAEYFPLKGRVVYHKYARRGVNYEVYRNRLNVLG